jgi:hypothetical protein
MAQRSKRSKRRTSTLKKKGTKAKKRKMSSVRRNYEYDHHYGLALMGRSKP